MKNSCLSGNGGRVRNFATIVYKESAPVDWLDTLNRLCIPSFVSPLHDKDIAEDGKVKKAHWHVMFMFDGVKSFEQCQMVVDLLGGVGLEIVQSVKAYGRYLCHLDSTDKVLYDIEDVQQFGGADYMSIIALATDKYKVIGDILDFCEQNRIISYAELIVWCRLNRSEWFRVLCDNGTYVVKEYLKSKSWTLEKEKI